MTMEPARRDGALQVKSDGRVRAIRARALEHIRKLSSVKGAVFLYLVTWLGCAVLLFFALKPKTTAREVIVTSAIGAATLLIVGVRLYDLISAIRKPRRRGY
jgi:hypothetical protein